MEFGQIMLKNTYILWYFKIFLCQIVAFSCSGCARAIAGAGVLSCHSTLPFSYLLKETQTILWMLLYLQLLLLSWLHAFGKEQNFKPHTLNISPHVDDQLWGPPDWSQQMITGWFWIPYYPGEPFHPTYLRSQCTWEFIILFQSVEVDNQLPCHGYRGQNLNIHF